MKSLAVREETIYELGLRRAAPLKVIAMKTVC
jgi:hypothetical protein